MNERVHVHVDIDGVTKPAGTLFVQTGRALSSSFSYDATYLTNSDAYALDPALPLHTASGHVEGLPGAFQDAAPDRWGRLLLHRHLQRTGQLGGRALTDLDYLLGVSDASRQGALRFSRVADGPMLAEHSHVPQLVSLPRLLRAAESVDRDADGIEATKILLDAGSGSLGGARPKASVRDGAKLHIAKFPHRSDVWDVMAWEATLLSLAARCGITTARHRLTHVGDTSVLLLERFDRVGEQRVGYLSGLSLIGGRDGGAHDYLEVADALASQSGSPHDDLSELWRRLMFSTLANNTDDHLRNLGLLRDRSGWRLSPAFDLNPNPDAARFQTSVLGEDTREGRFDALHAATAEFGLTRAAADAIASEVSAGLHAWRSVAGSLGVSAGEIELMNSAFAQRAN